MGTFTNRVNYFSFNDVTMKLKVLYYLYNNFSYSNIKEKKVNYFGLRIFQIIY